MMTAGQQRSRRRVNPFAIIIGGALLLLAFAAIYIGLAQNLHLWPYGRP
jgi:hypothetical protein